MYLYRTWVPADLTWLDRAVAVAAWESLSPEERLSSVPAAVADRAQQRLRGLFGIPWATAVIAQLGQEPAGFALVAIAPDAATEEFQGHLLQLWVAPAHRGRRLGTALSSVAEGLLARQNLRKVKIWTGLHNTPALRLALRAGYSPEGLLGKKPLVSSPTMHLSAPVT